MRALHVLSLAAALAVPAAAAHAQVGVYVGPGLRYAAPVYGPGFYGSRIHWDHTIYGRLYGAPWAVYPRSYSARREWRGYRGWAHDGRYAGRW